MSIAFDARDLAEFEQAIADSATTADVERHRRRLDGALRLNAVSRREARTLRAAIDAAVERVQERSR